MIQNAIIIGFMARCLSLILFVYTYFSAKLAIIVVFAKNVNIFDLFLMTLSLIKFKEFDRHHRHLRHLPLRCWHHAGQIS